MANTHAKTVGSRAEVWHGTAHHTSGGLTKKCLIKNKHGRIVSKKKHETAKKDRRLVKAGYGTKKGVFGYVKKNGTMSKKHKRSMKKRGKMGKKRGGAISASHAKTNQLVPYTIVGGTGSHARHNYAAHHAAAAADHRVHRADDYETVYKENMTNNEGFLAKRGLQGTYRQYE